MALQPSSVPGSSSHPPTTISNVSEPPASSASVPETTIRIEQFDGRSERHWRALIRDILALANSGGGRICLAAPVGEEELLGNLKRYTDSSIADVRVLASSQVDGMAAVIVVGSAIFPLGFSQPDVHGAAADSAAPPRAAPGFYFRHGQRTEPATTADMRSFVERLLRRMRRRWLRGIRRVLARPVTFDEKAAPKRTATERIRLERAVLQPVRIVADPNAPALQPQDVDQLYPWRQKDLLRELNDRLGRRALNSYDIQAVRRHHRLDERPEFVFNLPGAGRRYSPAVAEWMMEQYGRNPQFFQQARAADQEVLKLRRKKPR
jgi:hypothetical protein